MDSQRLQVDIYRLAWFILLEIFNRNITSSDFPGQNVIDDCHRKWHSKDVANHFPIDLKHSVDVGILLQPGTPKFHKLILCELSRWSEKRSIDTQGCAD